MMQVTHRPVVVGTVTLDVLRRGLDTADLRFGGVCNNVACALGALGMSPRFVTATFSGDLGELIPVHLERHGVEWHPLSTRAPLAYYEAVLDASGEVSAERFFDTGSLNAITAEALRMLSGVFVGAGAIVGCTDLADDAIQMLQGVATDLSIPFFLASTSIQEIEKIHRLKRPVDLLGMNLTELRALASGSFPTHASILQVVSAFSAKYDACLVTRGPDGASLWTGRPHQFIEQAALPVTTRSVVGAGDVFFAGLVAAHLAGKPWQSAMAFGAAVVLAYLSHDASRLPFLALRSLTDELWSGINR